MGKAASSRSAFADLLGPGVSRPGLAPATLVPNQIPPPPPHQIQAANLLRYGALWAYASDPSVALAVPAPSLQPLGFSTLFLSCTEARSFFSPSSLTLDETA